MWAYSPMLLAIPWLDFCFRSHTTTERTLCNKHWKDPQSSHVP